MCRQFDHANPADHDHPDGKGVGFEGELNPNRDAQPQITSEAGRIERKSIPSSPCFDLTGF